MKGLVVEISFFEAIFKVHYTKGFKQTYPIPLPTSVAGIFGALLGIRRNEIFDSFSDCLFGAKLLSYKGLCTEKTTYIQYKGGKPIRGVATSILLNNPSFMLALVAEESKVKDFYTKLKEKGIVYIPYGGQNDFFVEKIELIGIKDVNEKSLYIQNYAPQDFVEKIEWMKDTEFWILPVKHKFSSNLNFYFIFRGKLKLKQPICSIENIGVYSLENFYYLSQIQSERE